MKMYDSLFFFFSRHLPKQLLGYQLWSSKVFEQGSQQTHHPFQVVNPLTLGLLQYLEFPLPCSPGLTSFIENK